jgi:DNA-binding MarR family transcriptional regulator
MPTDPPTPPKLSPIAQELGKRNPFDLLEEEIFVGLLRTSDLLTAGFNSLFEQHGFSEKLYNTLRIIAGESEILNGGVPVGVIKQRLVCRQPDTSRLVDRLVNLGLAERNTCPEDARKSLVRVTSAGKAMLRKLKEPVQQQHRDQLSGLSRKQLEDLGRLLDAVRASVNSKNAEK